MRGAAWGGLWDHEVMGGPHTVLYRRVCPIRRIDGVPQRLHVALQAVLDYEMLRY